MNRRRFFLAVLLGGLSPGCGTFFDYAIHNVARAPLDAASNCARDRRLYQLARTTWEKIREENPEHEASPDYVCGFEDGFVDYLESGGNGEPPPNPPWRYRRARFKTPAGRQGLE